MEAHLDIFDFAESPTPPLPPLLLVLIGFKLGLLVGLEFHYSPAIGHSAHETELLYTCISVMLGREPETFSN